MKNLFLVLCVFVVGFSTTASGQVWSSVGGGVNSNVYAMAVDTVNNELYVGGWFTTAGGITAAHIAKWDGSSWSNVGSGMNNNSSTDVRTLCFFNGDLYAGGQFDSAGGVYAKNIAKWDGTSWSSLGSGLNATVYSLTVYNGQLYAGGIFNASGTTPLNNIAKWDGSTWLDVGGGANYYVLTLCDFNSDLYIGGYFQSVGGVNARRIAKWNGSVWDSVNANFNDVVRKLYVYNNELYAAGDFTPTTLNSATYISKYDGVNWLSFPSPGILTNGGIRDLYTYKGDLYITGNFNAPPFIAQYNGTGYNGLGIGLSWSGYCMTEYKNELYVGGYFSSAGGIPNTSGIAKWNNLVGEFEVISTDELSITPNPFQDQTTFTFPDSYLEREKFTVIINDETGRIVTRQILSRSNKLLFDRGKISSGIYYYHILGTENEMITNGKLVII